MARIFVSGLINLETTLAIEKFPLEYSPVNYPFFGVGDRISGVGVNVARALKTLGSEVCFASLLGKDFAGRFARETLKTYGLDSELIREDLTETPHSIILFENSGRRQIHVDLKNIQETPYPETEVRKVLPGCDLAVLCNINFSRPLLKIAKTLGIPIATDLHALSNLDDSYNRDFLETADIVFFSHEHLPASPEDFATALFDRYPAHLLVIGMGKEGALLGQRNPRSFKRFPAKTTRPIVNSIGAGDALFSAFVHGWCKHHDPVASLHAAQVFASWKIGANGGAEGFLTGTELDRFSRQD